MKLEQPIRAFTRRIEGMNNLSYWERLQKLKIYSIERRRERFTIIYMFKILNELVPNPGIDFEDKGRLGIKANVPKIANNLPTQVKNLKRDSFNQMSLHLIGPRCPNGHLTNSNRSLYELVCKPLV